MLESETYVNGREVQSQGITKIYNTVELNKQIPFA